ncbi:MAG: hypothetical protein MZV64_28920 [Ignavibacteriales bacterium]|nr:hypothetical protein [Ignavibacteriales bacterium]
MPRRRPRLRRLLREAAHQVRPPARDLPRVRPGRASESFLTAMPVCGSRRSCIMRQMHPRDELGCAERRRSLFTEHHESHAASAFYPVALRRAPPS